MCLGVRIVGPNGIRCVDIKSFLRNVTDGISQATMSEMRRVVNGGSEERENAEEQSDADGDHLWGVLNGWR